MPHDPPLEVYLSFQDRTNRRFHRRIMAMRQTPAPEWRRVEIPKVVWTFWAQGEASAPDIVRLCLQSWRARNPGWEIRCLDADALSDLVDVSHVPSELPWRFQADMARLELLNRYGGVWADCTSWCHRPLDDWLPYAAGSGFFVFSAPGPSRWFDNWFIVSEPGGPLISAWSDAYARYVPRVTKRGLVYFAMIYVLQWRILRERALQEAWRRVPRLQAHPCFLLSLFTMGLSRPEVTANALQAGLPVSKLSWKEPIDLDRLRSFLAEAENAPPQVAQPTARD
jgi:hypothetical protein